MKSPREILDEWYEGLSELTQENFFEEQEKLFKEALYSFDTWYESKELVSISQCPHCFCMSKNICGKCEKEK